MSDNKKYKDWWCDKCNIKIFGSKDKCFKCHTNRPNNTPVFNQQKVQDYDCPHCGHYNYARNEKCRICDHPPPKKQSQPIRGKPGDWFCPECGDFQFSKNKSCRKCGYIKEILNIDIDNISQDKFCLYCMMSLKDTVLVHSNNIAHLCVCYQCAEQLMKDQSKCPICRANIESINKVY